MSCWRISDGAGWGPWHCPPPPYSDPGPDYRFYVPAVLMLLAIVLLYSLNRRFP